MMYSLQTCEVQEDSPYFFIGTLRVFYLHAYTLLDLGANCHL